MRERLIELLRSNNAAPEKTCPRFGMGENCEGCKYLTNDESCDYIAREADYLLAKGVIVPPCKVKTTVYSQKGCFFLPYEKDINPKEVIPCEVIAIKKTKKGKYILLKPLLIETFGMRSSNEWFPFSAIGKTVFLTREEAEAVLVNYESSKNEKGGAE